MRRVIRYIIVASCILASGCTGADKRIKEVVARITKEPLSIPYDKLYKVSDDSVSENKNAQYRMIFYNDSLSCAPCALKHLPDLDQMLDSLNGCKDRITPLYLFDPPRSSREAFVRSAAHSYSHFPIYVDTCHAFIANNPQISNHNSLKIFLVNSRDSVLLVGNQLSNPKLQKLILKVVNKNTE